MGGRKRGLWGGDSLLPPTPGALASESLTVLHPGRARLSFPPPGSTSALLDLSGLDLPPAGTTYPAMPTCPADPASPEQPSTSVSLLDDELMSLGEEGAGPRGGRGGCRWG